MATRWLRFPGAALFIILALARGAQAQSPVAPVRGLASGDVLGSDLTFTWNPVSTATWYHLMVQDTAGVKLDAWFTTAQAHCGAGESSCYVRVGVTLTAGVVYWWVQSYNAGGYSPWSTRGEFTAAGVLQTSNALRNTFLGVSAGVGSPIGGWNTGVGHSSLQMLTGGEFNTALGASALGSATTGERNTAVGAAAMAGLTNGFGNTAVGTFALGELTSGESNSAVGHDVLSGLTSGTENAAVGSSALTGVTTGRGNVAIGPRAMQYGNADYNVAIGYYPLAGAANTGSKNIGIGFQALQANSGGEYNIAIGAEALKQNVGGGFNIAIGAGALDHMGSNNFENIAIGLNAGYLHTSGNWNVYIANPGVPSEVGVMRFGTQGTHNAAYISGISGATSASGVAVLVNTQGKLGTLTSSGRYKRDVRDIGDSSRALFDLRPVTFRYNLDLDPEGVTQYGLIAEEVAKVLPELVVTTPDGRVETVRYHLLVPMLLNEVQKQQRQIERQQQQIERLTEDVQQLLQRAQGN